MLEEGVLEKLLCSRSLGGVFHQAETNQLLERLQVVWKNAGLIPCTRADKYGQLLTKPERKGGCINSLGPEAGGCLESSKL
jgi:hypothetical protein